MYFDCSRTPLQWWFSFALPALCVFDASVIDVYCFIQFRTWILNMHCFIQIVVWLEELKTTNEQVHYESDEWFQERKLRKKQQQNNSNWWDSSINSCICGLEINNSNFKSTVSSFGIDSIQQHKIKCWCISLNNLHYFIQFETTILVPTFPYCWLKHVGV